ncbi:MAG: PAS domain S-box protein [Ignavibacteriae bacterium]|nr:PAS domain S-box protein [Ignavibacteriota bacterium]
MTTVYSPMIDAAMELKYEVTSAHLWFEEILSGDKEEDIHEVYSRLEYTQWFLNAMRNGDINDHGTFTRIDDPTIINHLGRLEDYIYKLISLTTLRYNLHDKGKAGTETDKQYDAIFNDFLEEASLLETNLKNYITSNTDKFRTIQIILFGLILLTALFVVFIFRYYEKQRTQIITKLESEVVDRLKTEKRFQDIAKSTGEWIWETNSEGLYTYGSSAVENLLGYKLNDIIEKKHFYDFFESDKKENLKNCSNGGFQ